VHPSHPIVKELRSAHSVLVVTQKAEFLLILEQAYYSIRL